MKVLNSMKLSQLNKDSLSEMQMNRIVGGYYCNFGDANLYANEKEGKCSCFCDSSDYHDTNSGLNVEASQAYHIVSLPTVNVCYPEDSRGQ